MSEREEPLCVRCGKPIRHGEPRLAYPPPEGPLHLACDRPSPRGGGAGGGPERRHGSVT